jgi:hypothetical protein
MDDSDRATAREEQERGLALAAALRRAPALHATGHCLYCGADGLAPGLRFCDAECRDGFDARLRQVRQSGSR